MSVHQTVQTGVRFKLQTDPRIQWTDSITGTLITDVGGNKTLCFEVYKTNLKESQKNQLPKHELSSLTLANHLGGRLLPG